MPQTVHVYSWPQMLTDWCVIQAFRRAGCPDCLRDQPALQAAFVSLLSAAVQLKTGFDRLAEIESILAAATESACEKAGGSAYLALREATAAATRRSLASHARAYDEHRADQQLNDLGPDDGYAEAERREIANGLYALIAEAKADDARTRALQEQLAALRRRFAPAAQAARRHAARAYWAKFTENWTDDSIFNDSPWPSIESRLARIDAAWWWRRFLPALQGQFHRGQPTEYFLHQQMPSLRYLASRPRQKVLAGVIDDWRETTGADFFGLMSPVHHSTLEPRAHHKARVVAAWFDCLVPDYSSNGDVRRAAADTLRRHLTEIDPQPFAPAKAPSSSFWEHSDN